MFLRCVDRNIHGDLFETIFIGFSEKRIWQLHTGYTNQISQIYKSFQKLLVCYQPTPYFRLSNNIIHKNVKQKFILTKRYIEIEFPRLIQNKRVFSVPLLLTTHNIFSDNINMVISIRPGVFMPKTYYMPQFVNNDSKFITVFSNTNSLSPISPLSYEWATTENDKNLI